jgi:hypothetical protein
MVVNPEIAEMMSYKFFLNSPNNYFTSFGCFVSWRCGPIWVAIEYLIFNLDFMASIRLRGRSAESWNREKNNSIQNMVWRICKTIRGNSVSDVAEKLPEGRVY